MNQTLKRILLILLPVLLIAAIAGIIYAAPMMTMHPTPTGAVEQAGDIYAIHNRQNSLYFIKSDDGYILIDAGSDMEAVRQVLPQSGIEPEEVKYILLTHTDSDHIASIPLFPNAQVYMSVSEQQMVDGSTKRNLFSKNTLPDGTATNDIKLLDHDDPIELGGVRILPISVPGHTTGSMVYLVKETYLFTGDAFKVKDNFMTVHPYSMDKNTAKQSISDLYARFEDHHMIFTSHYGIYDASDLKLK